jgi:hypothetical protein
MAEWSPVIEEPMLVDRFGTDYREYRRHVPRLLPRWRPWHPERPGGLEARMS